MISGVVRALLTDVDKDKFIEKLQSSCNNKYTLLSEDAKSKIGFEGILKDMNCANCQKKFNVLTACDIQPSRNVYCRCGTLLLNNEQIQRHWN